MKPNIKDVLKKNFIDMTDEERKVYQEHTIDIWKKHLETKTKAKQEESQPTVKVEHHNYNPLWSSMGCGFLILIVFATLVACLNINKLVDAGGRIIDGIGQSR